MRKLLLLPMVFFCFKTHAQFVDTMENYTVGERIFENHWTDFNCGGPCAIYASDDFAHDGSISGLIPGDTITDAVLDLGNKIFGTWLLEFWMYVPANKEAYFTILSTVPYEPPNIGHFYFNLDNQTPGEGVIEDIAIGDVSFTFPHDEWFRIIFWVDITSGIGNATWQLYINDVEIIPCETPFTKESGIYPTSLGGVEFFSHSTNSTFYIDDFLYWDPPVTCELGIKEAAVEAFHIFPNPVDEILKIEAKKNFEIICINIYDISGRLIETERNNFQQINISHLNKGLFFVEIKTNKGVEAKKVIKK
ncbi:MAG: T9SS type A sorting domain-containing protein [Flavobacteriaceae bacterium]